MRNVTRCVVSTCLTFQLLAIQLTLMQLIKHLNLQLVVLSCPHPFSVVNHLISLQYDVNLEVFEPDDITWYGRVLGKGGEGIVQECVVMYNDIPVDAAIKTMLNNSDDEVSITLDEIELLW